MRQCSLSACLASHRERRDATPLRYCKWALLLSLARPLT